MDDMDDDDEGISCTTERCEFCGKREEDCGCDVD